MMKGREKAIELHSKGFNMATISKRLGVSIAQVEVWIRPRVRGRGPRVSGDLEKDRGPDRY